MLEEISGMYSSVFGTKAGPDREKHPVVFLPDGSKKVRFKTSQINSQSLENVYQPARVPNAGLS